MVRKCDSIITVADLMYDLGFSNIFNTASGPLLHQIKYFKESIF